MTKLSKGPYSNSAGRRASQAEMVASTPQGASDYPKEGDARREFLAQELRDYTAHLNSPTIQSE